MASGQADTAGFSIRFFGLLAALVPIGDEDTPDTLRNRASDANMSQEYTSLFQEQGSKGTRLCDRLRALRLQKRGSDGCLVCVREDNSEVLLLPAEAFGLVIDMVALDVFARRKIHRGLSPDEVLREIGLTCFAGGRLFGALRYGDVHDRLACLSDPVVSDPSGCPSLTAVLYRVATEFDRVQSLCTADFAKGIMKALPGLRPWPSPSATQRFAAGELPYLLVPFCRHALRALPCVHEESSCFAYERSSVLAADGTTKVEYRCARSAAAQAQKKKMQLTGSDEKEDDDSIAHPEDESSSEGGLDEQDAVQADCEEEACSQSGDGCCEAVGGSDEAHSQDAAFAGSSDDPPVPPALRRQPIHTIAAAAATAADGLRSAYAPVAAGPTQSYVQACLAGLVVFLPPLARAGASMLLLRRLDAHDAVVRHCHRLDEHLPIADVLERAVLLGIKSQGSFNTASAECRHWLSELLPQIDANYKEYVVTSFRSKTDLKPPSLGGDACLSSPGGAGRARRGHHTPHELTMQMTAVVSSTKCPSCTLPLVASVPTRQCMAADCPSPQFHLTCAQVLDGHDVVDTAIWMCPTCEDRDAILRDDDSFIPDLITTTLLSPEEHAALLLRGHVKVEDVPAVLGLPRALSRHDPADVTQPALAALIKNASRFWRQQKNVSEALLKTVDDRVKAGLGVVDSEKDSTGAFVRFRAAIIDHPMREALYTIPDLGDNVSAADDTWHMIGRINDMNMYAALSPINEAGGATMPTVILLYKAGSGIAGDKADSISFAHAYLHKVRLELYDLRAADHASFRASGAAAAGAEVGARTAPPAQPPPPQPPHPPLPLPTVRLFDKDASSFLSHLNDCKRIAGTPEAATALAAVTSKLKTLAADATADEIAAGSLIMEALPGVDAAGAPRAADVVPPKPSELQRRFPVLARTAWQHHRKRFEEVFHSDVVDNYGPYLRGLAHVALTTLQSGVAAVKAATTSGDVNIAAARLLPVYFISARDSALADVLRRYYMHVVLLCDFHAWQAIERKLAGIDRDLRSAVKDGLHEVFADPGGKSGSAWAAFKTQFSELASVRVALDTTESGEGAGKRMNFFDYVESFWLCPRWWTTVSVRFRALFQRAGLNTTNDVELFWNTLKKSWFRGMRAGNTEVGLARVSASPVGSPAEVAAAVAKSYTGQRWSHIKDQLEGKVRLYPRAHRIQMVDAIAGILGRLRTGASSFTEDGPLITMGSSSGGFSFRDRERPVHNVTRMRRSDLLTLPHAAPLTDESRAHSQSCGRHTSDRIGDARSAAYRAAAANSTSVFTQRVNAAALVKRVCPKRPPEFDALQASVLSSEQLLQAAESLNPEFTGALAAIDMRLKSERDSGASIDVRTEIICNQELRTAVLNAWAALKLADFKQDCPHFAYIYAILLTMTALQWRKECRRVLVDGERVSLVFGDDLPLGYRVMLTRMLPLAEAASDSDLLTGIYFGQENRGAKSKGKCGRWQDHLTNRGSRNICQLKVITDRRSGGVVYTPLGDVCSEVRIVGMLPAGDKFASRINGAEALVYAACELVPGFVGMNDSPPGEDLRLLATTWAGPPRIIQLCEQLVNSLDGEEKACKVKLCDPAVSAKAGPFVRGVLEAVHVLMEHGHYVDKDGRPIDPDFGKAVRRTRFAQFSVQTLVSAVFGSIDEDGTSASRRSEYTLALWCDACSCAYVGPLCKHLLAVRILRLVQRLRPTWHGDAEALYWGAGPLPSYAVRTVTTPLKAVDAAEDAEAEAVAAEDIPALFAAAGHHLALFAGRIAAGDSGAVRLTDVASALQGFVKRAAEWSGARVIEPGRASRSGGILGLHRSRASTPGEIDADRAAGSQLREKPRPGALLDLLAKAHPLPRPGAPQVASHSTAQHAAAAVNALCAAAPHAAAAKRAASASAVSAPATGAEDLEAAAVALVSIGGDSLPARQDNRQFAGAGALPGGSDSDSSDAGSAESSGAALPNSHVSPDKRGAGTKRKRHGASA